jgi:hypothetical protein
VATYACVLPRKSPQKVEPGAARLSRPRRVVSRIFAISLSVDDSPQLASAIPGGVVRWFTDLQIRHFLTAVAQ